MFRETWKLLYLATNLSAELSNGLGSKVLDRALELAMISGDGYLQHKEKELCLKHISPSLSREKLLFVVAREQGSARTIIWY